MFQIDTYQVSIFFCFYFVFFLLKSLWIRKKVVPLHPLSGRVPKSNPKKSSLKDLHKTEEVVVQEARGFMSLG